MRTHSTYEREIQDLPIQEKKVILLVTTRKMFCDNPECEHTTFAEVHPFAAPKAQKKSSVTKVCVDDFALRKRFSYGTVMVDLESHRIIDLISSRETTNVANWLATFPNIQVISRDGAATYSSAATGSHPEAIQVSDRFHLIKWLSEAINKYIIREFPARIGFKRRGKPCITRRTIR